MQQVVRYGNVGDVGGGGRDARHQLGFGIDTEVGIHRRRTDTACPCRNGPSHNHGDAPHFWSKPAQLWGGIHPGALGQQQTALAQQVHGVEGSEDRLCQSLFFQQVEELEQGGGIGERLPAKIDAQKPVEGLAVVEGICQGLVRQAEPLLQEVEA